MATGIEGYLAQDLSPGIGEAYATGRAQNLNQKMGALEYQERLKNAEVTAMQRKLDKQRLQFQNKHQGEQLNQKLQSSRMEFDARAKEELANDLQTAIDNPNEYERLTQDYAKRDMLAPEFVGPDGNILPYEKGKDVAKKVFEEVKNNLDHQRKLEIATLSAYLGQSSPSFAATGPSGKQQEFAFDDVAAWTENKGLNLGDFNEAGSDSRFLANTATELANSLARKLSDQSGEVVNPAEVRNTVLKLSERHIERDPAWYLPKSMESHKLNRDALLSDINKFYGLPSGTMQGVVKERYGASSLSGPSKVVKDQLREFRSQDEVQRAVGRGELEEGDTVVINGKERTITFE